VKALVRPNLPAWAANQVYWSARPEFDALLASVERLRKTQQSGAGGTALRDAMKARRETLDLAVRAASARLASAGHGTNPDTLHRVSKTLEALAAQAARPGRLVQDLEPPGFDAFATSGVAEMPRRSPRAEPAVPATVAPVAAEPSVDRVEAVEDPAVVEQRRAEDLQIAQEQRRTTLAECEQRLDLARRQAREAAGAQSVAEKRAEAAKAELEEATRRFERAKERAVLTAEDEIAARRTAEQLAAARDVAEADRDDALRALKASGPSS
jgi:hypothetical protein